MNKKYSNEWAVEARGLVKVFGDNRAVDGVDLNVCAGSIYGVLGPNGAGKTTTIRMLATLLRADGGEARIFGHDVTKEAHVVRQLIGVTGQYASVDESLSATENLIIFSRLLGLGRAEAKRKAAELLEEFGLTEAAKRPLKHFSGGCAVGWIWLPVSSRSHRSFSWTNRRPGWTRERVRKCGIRFAAW